MKTNLQKFLLCHLSCLFLFLPISAHSSLNSELGSSRPTHEGSSTQIGCRLGLDNLYRAFEGGKLIVVELNELNKYSCQRARDMAAVEAAYGKRASEVETETAFLLKTSRGGTTAASASNCSDAGSKAAAKCASGYARPYAIVRSSGGCAVHARCL